MRIEMVHLQVVKDKMIEYTPSQTITMPKAAAEWVRTIIENVNREQILVCGMDAKMNPTFLEIVAMGSVNECPVSMAEVFKTVLVTNSYGIMVFHNHPSGDCSPSVNDFEITERINKAANLLDIKFLDHIIVGDGDDYFSFAEQKVLNLTNTKMIGKKGEVV